MNLKGRAGMFATVLDYEKNPADAGTKGWPEPKCSLDEAQVAFGGRSMGARAAVLAAHSNTSIRLLVLVSYPLVGPKGDVRDQILLDVRPEVDVLFISGDGDSMCDMVRLTKVRAQMRAKSWLVVVEGADHGMKLQGGSKLKKGSEEVGRETGRIAAKWIEQRDEKVRDMVLKWDGDRGEVVGAWTSDEAEAAGKVKVPSEQKDDADAIGSRTGTKRKRSRRAK
jgi:hypothetical protein